jgi:hypothetical protein
MVRVTPLSSRPTRETRGMLAHEGARSGRIGECEFRRKRSGRYLGKTGPYHRLRRQGVGGAAGLRIEGGPSTTSSPRWGNAPSALGPCSSMQTGTGRDAPDLKLEGSAPSHPDVKTTGQPDPVSERTYRRPRQDGRLSRQVKIGLAIRSVTTRFSAQVALQLLDKPSTLWAWVPTAGPSGSRGP